MVTRRPRSLRSRPRLDAVKPLPRLEATPPVTKRCLVARAGLPVTAVGKRDAPVVVVAAVLTTKVSSQYPRATRITGPGHLTVGRRANGAHERRDAGQP